MHVRIDVVGLFGDTITHSFCVNFIPSPMHHFISLSYRTMATVAMSWMFADDTTGNTNGKPAQPDAGKSANTRYIFIPITDEEMGVPVCAMHDAMRG